MHILYLVITVLILPNGLEVKSQDEMSFAESLDLLARWANVKKNGNMHQHLSIVADSFWALISRENVMEGAFQKGFPPKSYNISSACIADLEQVMNSIGSGELYALTMLDAIGKPGSGILQGNLIWLGSYSQCRQITPSIHHNDSSIHSFETKYCTVSITNITSYEPSSPVGSAGHGHVLFLGVCVPDSCDEEDVRALPNLVLDLLPSRYADLEAVAAQCQVDRDKRPIDAPAIGIMFMLSVLAVLIVCGSFLDLFFSYQAKSIVLALPVINNDQNMSVNTEEDISTGSGENECNQLIHSASHTRSDTSPGSVVGRLLLAFSVFTNGEKLLRVDTPRESDLAAIHGIRFLSMSWVVLGHTYVFPIRFFQNPAAAYNMAKRFTFQAILNASVSVDSFFVLSGTLVSLLLLREISSKGGPRRVSWWKFYIHRYWRLTPPYMLVLGTYVALFKYSGEGPMWPKTVDPNCHTSWWTNLLYINNLVHADKKCLGWTWYLANDMQFFILSPLLVVPFVFSSIAGVIINMLFLVASLVSTGVLTHKNGYPADVPSYIGDPAFVEKSADYMKDVYITPWCRIGPYVIGVLVGYLLHRTKRVVKMHWFIAGLGWVVAAVLNTSVLYGLYNVANGHNLSSGINAFYAATHRSVWALGVGWVIFACCTGNGGPVNRLLSWAALVPLSRLTYMAYLIHPIILSYYLFTMEEPLLLTDINMIYLFLGNMMVTYGIAFVVSLTFEAPMIGLEKVILHRN